MKKVILLFSILVICSSATAGQRPNNFSHILDLPETRLLVHREPNINFSVTNFGLIGSMNSFIPDPDNGWYAPGAIFPANSGIENLFFGSIWIGAEIDTFDSSGNPILDTLVSVGNDGWWSNTWEWFPPLPADESLRRIYDIGDEDIAAIYCDTFTDRRFVAPDPNDGRPHIPLGLRITQNSFGWSTIGYNDLAILKFVVENIGGRNLHNVWFGIYYNGDVYYPSEDPFDPGWIDDLSGFVEYSGHDIAWTADNDGQPYNGQFDYRSPLGVLGLMLLGTSQGTPQTNFNWWISNTSSEIDWGPQLISNFDRWGVFPGGGRGTPGGDKAKYQVMSNGEHDYDQAYAAIDYSGSGWIEPCANATSIADGIDTQYLISFGPFQFSPNSVETLTVAYIGGQHLHVDPQNFAQNLQDHTGDTISIRQYYNNLNFSNLYASADSAINFYNRGYANIPLGPPRNLRVTEWSGSQISFIWSRKNSPRFAHYNLYRGTAPGVYGSEPITPDNFTDTVFVDNTVQDNTQYYYAIASVDISGIQGGFSSEIPINSGRPHMPQGLTATGGDLQVQLTWNVLRENDIIGYNIYRSEHTYGFELIDFAPDSSYLDQVVGNGITYYYYITALDSVGNSSAASDTASAIPMWFGAGILIVNGNRDDFNNPDYDSMMVFYDNIFSEYNYTILNRAPYSISDLVGYSTVVLCKELYSGRLIFDPGDQSHLYTDYLNAGGNLLLFGTRLVVNQNFYGRHDYVPNDFAWRFLNLAGVEFPSSHNSEFIGGHSVVEGFPDFDVDTTRARRIIVPPNDHTGRLMGIGTLIPNDSSEVIYKYVAVNPDTSIYHDRPIGIIHHGQNFNTGVMEFPLYYVEEPASYDILYRVLDELGETRNSVDEHNASLPNKVALLQNYPNPFNPSTKISYQLPKATEVAISIYNIVGQRVVELFDGRRDAGYHEIIWNASEYPSGIYFARLNTSEKSATIKMLLMK